jgi:two-component system, OmpR family, sensor kinase
VAARRGAAECHRGRDFSSSGAFQEANEIQDGQLEERASLLTVAPMETGSHRYVPSDEPDGKVVVQKLGNTASDRLLHFPGAFTDDIQTRVIDGRKWRQVDRTLAPVTRVVNREQMTDRDEIETNSAIATLIQFIALRRFRSASCSCWRGACSSRW